MADPARRPPAASRRRALDNRETRRVAPSVAAVECYYSAAARGRGPPREKLFATMTLWSLKYAPLSPAAFGRSRPRRRRLQSGDRNDSMTMTHGHEGHARAGRRFIFLFFFFARKYHKQSAFKVAVLCV